MRPLAGPGYIGVTMRRALPRLLFLVPAGLVACSPAPVPVSCAADDPSNPRAAEGIDPVPAVRTSAAPPTATVYACPMHPEVTSSHPAKCPKCGMNLVPHTEAR